MKKKVVIIIVVAVVVLVILGFLQKKDRKKAEFDTSKIEKIVINENANDVKIEQSSDDKIHVEYSEGNDLEYTIEQKDGTLTIENDNKAVNITLGFSISDETMIIKIPKDYGKDIEAKVKNKCKCDDSIKFDSKSIECNNEDE